MAKKAKTLRTTYRGGDEFLNLGARCKVRNVSTTYQERYTTMDGNAILERVEHGAGRGAWNVLIRGRREPYTVGNKQQAIEVACQKTKRKR